MTSFARESATSTAPEPQTRAGYVAILGRPNAGKSTLLNRLLEEKVAITSPKPQTTRRRVAGILTRGAAQAVFVDTPGLLDPAYPLQEALMEEVAKALAGVDLVYLLRDREEALAEEHAVLESLGRTPTFFVLTKSDVRTAAEVEALLAAAASEHPYAERHAVSALSGAGLEELLEATFRRLPSGEFFFEPDQLSDRSMRFLVAELVRETLFEELEQEVPYASHVEITAFDESRAVPRIEAVIYLERESQKGIVIGRGGETLKRIGARARAKIEALAARQVFLQLHVKVRHNWRRKDIELRRFGYRS